MKKPKTNHILWTHDCAFCGAPCGTGAILGGVEVYFDLKVRVFALIGGQKPFEIARTDMAYALHEDVCGVKKP